jgi:hypothetical protein
MRLFRRPVVGGCPSGDPLPFQPDPALTAFGIGGASHRRWIEAAFTPHLPARGRARERMIVKLFAATDFYQWKLLRVDLGLPLGEVERTMREIVEAIVKERS